MINEIQAVRAADLMLPDLNFYKESSLMYVCNKYWQSKHISCSFVFTEILFNVFR